MDRPRRPLLVLPLAAALLAAAIVVAPGARAAEADPDDRLGRLEELVRRQAQELDRLRDDLATYRRANAEGSRFTDDELRVRVDSYLAASGGATIAVGRDEPPAGGIRWGGYAQFVFEAPSDANSHFDLHRLILRGEAPVTECIDFDFELEIEHGGVSDEVPGEIVLEQAEFAFHLSDAFTPLVGGILIPFGRYNLHHDDPINDLTARPFTARYLMPTGFCQPGVGVQGAAPFGSGHAVEYKVALTNGYKDGFDADAGVRDARGPWDEDSNDTKQVWGRVAATWCVPGFSHVETGLSGTWSRFDVHDENTLTGFGADLLVRRGAFELSAEYLRQDYERDNADDPPDAVRGQYAWYVQGAYHFFPGWLCCTDGCLKNDTSLFTLVARYEEQDLDDRVRGATFHDDLRALTVGLNYRLTERTVFRVDHTWFFAASEDDEDRWTLSFATFF